MLTELTGKVPDQSVSADEAVAHGAALYADMLIQKRGLAKGHTTFSITNVNSHSLGIVGADNETGSQMNSIVIRKNTALPVSVMRRFKTAKSDVHFARVVSGKNKGKTGWIADRYIRVNY
jgi:molecular chaperone DnaK